MDRLMGVGGETVEVKRTVITGKALTQAQQFFESCRPQDFYRLVNGQKVRRMADSSRYFIFEHEGVRYVLIPTKGRSEGSGYMTIVTVQRAYSVHT